MYNGDMVTTGVLAGRKMMVAAALNLVEDTRPAKRERIADLLGVLRGGDGHRVGLTGPPGVGKSTLTAAVARELRRRDLTVGVVAVDPSSARSGGALLGDRARMSFDADDEGLLVRSLATHGHSGGLAEAVPAAVEVLAAAYDVVLIETTGVGQSEVDVQYLSETTLVVVQPGSGDSLQFLKAGIMEIPDLFVVNKADVGAGDLADRAVSDLVSALGTAARVGMDSARPVLKTSATTGEGIVALVDALVAREDAPERAERRREGELHWAFSSFLREHGEHGVRTLGGRRALLHEAPSHLADKVPPAVAQLWSLRYLAALSTVHP